MNCSWAHHRSRSKATNIPWPAQPLDASNPFNSFLSIDNKKLFFLPFRNLLKISMYDSLDSITLLKSINEQNQKKCLTCDEKRFCHTRSLFTECWEAEINISRQFFTDLLQENYSVGMGHKAITDIQYNYRPVQLSVHYPRFRTPDKREYQLNLWPLSFFGLSVTARLAESLASLYATHSQSLLQEGYGVSVSQIKAVIQRYLKIYSFVGSVSLKDIACLSGTLGKKDVLYLLDGKNRTILDVIDLEQKNPDEATTWLRNCYASARFSHSFLLDASQKYTFTSLSHHPLWQMTVVCTYLEKLADLQRYNTEEQKLDFLSTLNELHSIAASTHKLYLEREVDMERVRCQQRAFSDFIQNDLIHIVDTYLGYDCILWDFQDALSSDGPVMSILNNIENENYHDPTFYDEMLSFAQTVEKMTASMPNADFEMQCNRIRLFNPAVKMALPGGDYAHSFHLEYTEYPSPAPYDTYHKIRIAPSIRDLEVLISNGLLDTSRDVLALPSFDDE